MRLTKDRPIVRSQPGRLQNATRAADVVHGARSTIGRDARAPQSIADQQLSAILFKKEFLALLTKNASLQAFVRISVGESWCCSSAWLSA